MMFRVALLAAFAAPAASSTTGSIIHAVAEIAVPTSERRLVAMAVEMHVLPAKAPARASSGPIAYRPVDASLLHAVAYSPGGDVWIAPFFNGVQWGGAYERAVRFDPHSSVMTTYKIARLNLEASTVAPAEDGGAWALYGNIAAVGRYSPDGALMLFVASTTASTPQSLAVDSLGDAWIVEPVRIGLGRIDRRTGEWTDVDLPATLGSLAAAAIDSDDAVWFASSFGPSIVRNSSGQGYRRIALSAAPEPPSIVAPARDGDVWFSGEHAVFGRAKATSGAVSLWRLPGSPISSLASGSSGHAWVLESPTLFDFDASTSTGTPYALPSIFSRQGDVAADQRGGAWISGKETIGHVDANPTRINEYHTAMLSLASGLIAGSDGRVCFVSDEKPACLSDDATLRTFETSFNPGIIGALADRDGIWLIERGRATRVDNAGTIRRFAYASVPNAPSDAAVSPDGTLWLAGAGSIERFSRSGSSVAYKVTAPRDGPFGIAPDGRGGVLFAVGHGIGDLAVDAAGHPRLTFHNTGAGSSPEAVAAAPDGSVWCTDTTGAMLHITRDGGVERYPTPTRGSEPFGIALGSDGTIWFTEFLTGRIGRIDPRSRAIVEYPIPFDGSFPTSITAGDGAMWFMDLNGNIGKVSMAGTITEIPVPIPPAKGY